jgi:hypothetical protein
LASVGRWAAETRQCDVEHLPTGDCIPEVTAE